MSSVTQESTAPLIEINNNISQNMSIMKYIIKKGVIFNGLVPILSFGLMQYHLSIIKTGGSIIFTLENLTIYSALILYYWRFMRGTSKVVTLVSTLSNPNELSNFSEEEALMYLHKLSEYGSANANLRLELLGVNETMKHGYALNELNHSISSMTIIIASACISLSCSAFELGSGADMMFILFKLHLIFGCAFLDVFSLLWLHGNIDDITKSLYLVAKLGGCSGDLC